MNISDGKSKEKRTLKDLDVNGKIIFKGMDWAYLVQDRVQW
jgi:hypothetical protein